MRKTLSRKRKRNPKTIPPLPIQKPPQFPRFTELNGYQLIELNEDEITKAVTPEQLSNNESNELPLKEEKISSREYTRLRSKARSIEGHYITQQGYINIKENCFNCLMTDFNANELLYFNNRNDLLCYFQYCFQVKKRLLFTDQVTYSENKTDVLKCGNSFLNGWRFFIPKTMCKLCFMRMINMKSLMANIKTIFSDTEKDSQCKTNYRNYALFSPRFRNAFSLTKRIPNRKALKNAKRNRRSVAEKNNKYIKDSKSENKTQIIIIKDDIQDQNSPVIIERSYNPNIEFDKNRNILTINKKIFGDINIGFLNENIENNVKKKNEINKEDKLINVKDKKNIEKKNEKLSKTSISKNDDFLKMAKKTPKNFNKKEEKKSQPSSEEEIRKENIYKNRIITTELDNNQNIYLNSMKLFVNHAQRFLLPSLKTLITSFQQSEIILKTFIHNIPSFNPINYKITNQLRVKTNKPFFDIEVYNILIQEIQRYIDACNKIGMIFQELKDKFTFLLIELNKIEGDPNFFNAVYELATHFVDIFEGHKLCYSEIRQTLIEFIKYYSSFLEIY